MYEIWLMLNIVWELALSIWPWLVALAVLWLVLMMMAKGGRAADWRAWAAAYSLPMLLIEGDGVAGARAEDRAR